jgi:hypothetical protein
VTASATPRLVFAGLAPACRGIAALAAAIALPLAATSARAQGSFSGQGFGYPPGQLSTRSLSTGGALAEFDPQSTVNPQALSDWGPAGIYFQYEPEFRTVSFKGLSDQTTTSRFPVAAAALPVGAGRFVFGVSASTFLDRTWTTRSVGQDSVAGTPVTVIERFATQGAINDLRFAGAYEPFRSLRFGVGIHVYTGRNRVALSDAFIPTDSAADSVDLAAATTGVELGYSGTAISGGFEWRPVRALALAASGRRGSTLRLDSAETEIARARVPDRWGVGLRFDGVKGAVLAARVDWEGWSSLTDLAPSRGTPPQSLPASDTYEYGIGADLVGPRIGSSVIGLRLGARLRDLPFGARAIPLLDLPEAKTVREVAYSGGLGIPLAQNRAMVDLGVQYADRSASGRPDVKEHAWTLSFGLRVRP